LAIESSAQYFVAIVTQYEDELMMERVETKQDWMKARVS